MRNTAINILILLITILLCLVFLETGLRIFTDIGSRSGHLVPKMESPQKITPRSFLFESNYNGMLISRDFKVTYKVNSLGFRERDIDFAELSTQRPYLFLGDSFFNGWGVERKARISEVFVRKLRSKGVEASALNFSVPGYGSYQTFDVLKHYADKINPRLIIIGFFIGNDFVDDLKTLKKVYTKESDDKKVITLYIHKIKTTLRKFFRDSPTVNLVKYSLWELKYFRYIFDKLSLQNDRIELYKKDFSLLQDELYSATFSAFDEIAEFSRSHNLPLLVVMIPDNLQTQKPELFSEYDYMKPQKKLKAHLDKLNIPYLDLLDDLLNVENLQSLHFREDKHWNEKGNEIVAGILVDYVTAGKI